ncbi:MAG TPA: hypothetical protein VFC56_18535 [Stellaceae bacterium]|nr:hypothetical protein [Stellaceae bacterium]
MTLETDVAAALESRRRTGDKSLKELINTALRRGLKELAAPARPRKESRTHPVSLGRCLIGDVVSVSDALAIAEGEQFK